MAGKFLASLFFILCVVCLQAYPKDTVALQTAPDSVLGNIALLDSNPLNGHVVLDSAQSFLTSGGKTIVNDIEQTNTYDRNTSVFLLLVVMLGALTYLKTAFGKDLEDLVQ